MENNISTYKELACGWIEDMTPFLKSGIPHEDTSKGVGIHFYQEPIVVI